MEILERIKRRLKNKENFFYLILFSAIIIFFMVLLFELKNIEISIAAIAFLLVILGMMFISESNADESEMEKKVDKDIEKIKEKSVVEKKRYLRRKIIKYEKSVIPDMAVVISVFTGFIGWIISKQLIRGFEFYAITFLLIVLLVISLLLSGKYNGKMREYYQIELDLL